MTYTTVPYVPLPKLKTRYHEVIFPPTDPHLSELYRAACEGLVQVMSKSRRRGKPSKLSREEGRLLQFRWEVEKQQWWLNCGILSSAAPLGQLPGLPKTPHLRDLAWRLLSWANQENIAFNEILRLPAAKRQSMRKVLAAAVHWRSLAKCVLYVEGEGCGVRSLVSRATNPQDELERRNLLFYAFPGVQASAGSAVRTV